MSENLGERLKSLRKQKGMTQTELAKAIGSSAGYISEIENGTKQPGSGHLLSLKQVLGVSLDELVEGVDPTKKPHDARQMEGELSKGQELAMVQELVTSILPDLAPPLYNEFVMLALEELDDLKSLARPEALKGSVERWLQITRLLAAQNAAKESQLRAKFARDDGPPKP